MGYDHRQEATSSEGLKIVLGSVYWKYEIKRDLWEQSRDPHNSSAGAQCKFANARIDA